MLLIFMGACVALLVLDACARAHRHDVDAITGKCQCGAQVLDPIGEDR